MPYIIMIGVEGVAVTSLSHAVAGEINQKLTAMANSTFAWVLDVVMQNCWILYRAIQKTLHWTF